MNYTVFLLLITLIPGCAITDASTPYLTKPPLSQYDSLDEYWLSDNNVQPLRYLTFEQRKACRGKSIEIKASYLIDSNGDVFNVEIFESNVDVPMEALVAKTLQKRDFYPSESNDARQPVLSRAGLSFKCD